MVIIICFHLLPYWNQTIRHLLFKSLQPSDSIWQHRSWSTLVPEGNGWLVAWWHRAITWINVDFKNCTITLKFDRHLSSSVADLLVKFQSDAIGHAKFFRGNINMNLHYVTPSHWYDTSCWNPSSGKTGIYLFYRVSITTADNLATLGARASATMIWTSLNQDNSVPAR